MHSRYIAAVTLLFWLSVFPAASQATTPAPATQDDATRAEEPDKPTHTNIDSDTSKRLTGAMKALGDGRYVEAREILSHINPSRLNPFAASRVEQLYASIEQADDKYAAARQHLLAAVATGGLSADEASTARFQIAQFSLALQDWRQGIDDLKEWFATTAQPTSVAYYLLGAAYYQVQDYDSALEPASKAIELADAPQENWLQLLLALRVMREEYDQAVPILKRLVATYPTKKTYWTQLSSVYAALGQYDDATAAMQLAYDAGLLTEDQDIQRLAQLLVHSGIPRRAAEILAGALDKQKRLQSDPKTYELIGNCWVAAREYEMAIEPLARAAELSDNGEAYVRLAEVHVQLEDWNKAAEALRRGLEKGSLESPGHAQLLLGIAFYNRKNTQAARSWLEQALADETTRSQAEAWLKQLDVDATSHS